MLTTILESFDTYGIIATTTSSITLSLRRIRFIVIPTSNGTACALAISIEVIYEIVMQKFRNHKKTKSKRSKNNYIFWWIRRKKFPR